MTSVLVPFDGAHWKRDYIVLPLAVTIYLRSLPFLPPLSSTNNDLIQRKRLHRVLDFRHRLLDRSGRSGLRE